MKLIPATDAMTHRSVAESLLELGIIMVHILPSMGGVRLPPQFANAPILRLNFSYRYGIQDFAVDDDGIRASLSFGGRDCFCDIPWTAVLGISSEVKDELYIWPDNFTFEQIEPLLPKELAAQIRAMEEAGAFEEDESNAGESADAHDAQANDTEDEDEDDEDDDDIPPGGYTPLRLV